MKKQVCQHDVLIEKPMASDYEECHLIRKKQSHLLEKMTTTGPSICARPISTRGRAVG